MDGPSIFDVQRPDRARYSITTMNPVFPERTLEERADLYEIIVNDNDVEDTSEDHEYFINMVDDINEHYRKYEDIFRDPSNIPPYEKIDEIKTYRLQFLKFYDLFFFLSLRIALTNDYGVNALEEFDSVADHINEIELELAHLFDLELSEDEAELERLGLDAGKIPLESSSDMEVEENTGN